ncbi:MAG: serine/threonine-protein kinase PknK [Acidimicrobiaceae bacterium]
MATNQPVDLGVRGVTDAVEIGRGGFAVVYRAFQPAFERFVAVKVLDISGVDDSAQSSFQRECRAIGTLSGRPNILTVHEAGLTETGKPYLVMALAKESLEDRLDRQGPLPVPEAVGIGLKVAGALEFAHGAGILHRDVKPANILLSDDGEPQLADFGIARVASTTLLTRSGLAFTPTHAPPEAMEGKAPTPASDVYSLASTIFNLIAGHPAFVESADESLFVVLARVGSAPVPDLRPQGVPDSLCSVIENAMAKDPAERPPSAAAFASALALARLDGREEAPVAARAFTPASPGGAGRTVPAADTGAAVAEPAPPASPPDGPEQWASRASLDRRRVVIRSAAVGLVAVLVVGAVALAIATRGGSDKPSVRTAGIVPSTGSAPGPAATGTRVVAGFHPIAIGTALARSSPLIAFTEQAHDDKDNGMWVMSPDGFDGRRVDPPVPNCDKGGMGALRWDGKAILFSPGLACGIMTVDIDGTGLKTVDKDGTCEFGCDWSPDGRNVVYNVRGFRLVVAAADGSGSTEVADGQAPEWSVDGKMIAFQTVSNEISVLDVTTGVATVVGKAEGGLRAPTFDPSGTRLAVGTLFDGLKTIDVATHIITPLCPAAGKFAGNPSWSPDGTSIAYDASNQLGICDLSSGAVRTLPKVGLDRNPSWR